MSSSVETVIKTAEAEVGYTEGRTRAGRFDNNTKYADEVPGLEWADFQPWCATFVAWVALKSGVGELYPRTASCDTAATWFKAHKRWSEYPAVGAQVFYGRSSDLNHTGIVVSYDATHIETIEGNTNDDGGREGHSVMRKRRERRSRNVIGYGYPLFVEGIESADPAFAPHKVTTDVAEGLHVDGIDISHWQDGEMDFDKARRAGVKFVVHKATEGTGMRDPLHDQRRGEVAQAGLAWGAYHFARPEKSSGAKQAQFFLSTMRPGPGNLRPVLDLEKTGGLTPDRLGEWATDFAEEVRMRVGATPIIYTPFSLPKRLGPLWVARYSNANKAPRIPHPWKAFSIWQFSDGTFGNPRSVPGIGHCDANMLGHKTDLARLLLA
jgi:GH25 family lysozyme M1 (1,4-beta-N-acetylmuramidase)